MRYESLVESVGHTPLVRLQCDHTGGAAVYAKLELLNPFGHKDRFASWSLRKAKATGELKSGDIVIESSSGTLALGLAMVGRSMGHEVHIVTDPRTDALTLAKLRALGAIMHVVDRPNEHGWQGARLAKVEELMTLHKGAFWTRQYSNPENPAAFTLLADELLEDLKRIDILVAPVGSGGLLCGTARVLKVRNPLLRVVAVDAVGSIIFDQPHNSKRLLNGLGNSLVPENVDHTLIDEVHWINDEEGFAATVRLARDEQIVAGCSSGAAYWVARWLAGQVSSDHVIAVMFPDRGDRYYETVFNEDFWSSRQFSMERLPSAPQEVSYRTPVKSWSWAKVRSQ